MGLDNPALSCWCGNTDLETFSGNFLRCPACGSLRLNAPPKDVVHVSDSKVDLYGKDYYLKRQPGKYGYPELSSRARTDLPERCLHWLRTLLPYKTPAANILELGSAHGGFVALLQSAGFCATGLELSPWLVDFARSTFGVTMLLGPIEEQDIPKDSLDAIVLMDVLEHILDPIATLSYCTELLLPDGIFIIQTPSLPSNKSYEAMIADNDPFLLQLKEEEHIHLFNKESIVAFLRKVGMANVSFEPAIFAHYDMFVVASREPLKQSGTEAIEAALAVSPGGRMVQALIDIDDMRKSLADRNVAIEADLSALRHSLAELDEKLSLSRAELSASRAELSASRVELSASRVELEMIRQSMSWRITGPLRRLLDLLHRKRH